MEPLSKRIFSLIAEYNANPPPPFFVMHSACRAQASRYHQAAMAIVLPIEDMERCIENLGDILETYAYRYEKMEDTKDGYKALYEQAQERIEALEKHEIEFKWLLAHDTGDVGGVGRRQWIERRDALLPELTALAKRSRALRGNGTECLKPIVTRREQRPWETDIAISPHRPEMEEWSDRVCDDWGQNVGDVPPKEKP